MNYRQKIRVAHQLRHPFGAENETRARFAGILATSTLPPRRFAAVPSGGPGSLVQRLFRKTKKANHKGEGTEKVPLEAP